MIVINIIFIIYLSLKWNLDFELNFQKIVNVAYNIILYNDTFRKKKYSLASLGKIK